MDTALPLAVSVHVSVDVTPTVVLPKSSVFKLALSWRSAVAERVGELTLVAPQPAIRTTMSETRNTTSARCNWERPTRLFSLLDLLEFTRNGDPVNPETVTIVSMLGIVGPDGQITADSVRRSRYMFFGARNPYEAHQDLRDVGTLS